ncbi:MAG: DegT/DnrJ/EryC1/StrS family aminotransferase, partial [Pseudomonadota bacterium]
GGILVTDNPELIARAVIMSGAYEHAWKKHEGVGEDASLQAAFARWQNKLPLYNTRLNNLSAALVRAQIPEIARRVRDGLAGHDRVATQLNASPWMEVPAPLGPERRAPDSIQFNLCGMSDGEVDGFTARAAEAGVKVQVFGRSADNARAFWNWQFLQGGVPDLPQTRAMLLRACDVRLPARLTRAELDYIANALVGAAEEVMERQPIFGT